MKKILFLLSLSLLSCVSGTQTKSPARANAECVGGANFGQVIEYGYKGHDYIMFITPANGYPRPRVAGIVHNPDCHCFKDSIKNQ